MSRTTPAELLRFVRSESGWGLKDPRHSKAPWRFVCLIGGVIEAWESSEYPVLEWGRWVKVNAIPEDSSPELIEQTLRAMAMLGMDTGD